MMRITLPNHTITRITRIARKLCLSRAKSYATSNAKGVLTAALALYERELSYFAKEKSEEPWQMATRLRAEALISKAGDRRKTIEEALSRLEAQWALK